MHLQAHPKLKPIIPFLAGIVAAYAVCFYSPETIRTAAIITVITLIAVGFFRSNVIIGRFWGPVIALSLYVAVDGISLLYAGSPRYSYTEFLKVFAAFSFALVLLFLSPADCTDGRWLACLLATCTAFIGLISIDQISTRFLSSAFFSLLSSDYQNPESLEVGVRMTSFIMSVNCFAGVTGIGSLLSIGLVRMSDGGAGSRSGASEVSKITGHFVNTIAAYTLLFINALSFLLAFSMGASCFFIIALIVYVLLESSSSRVRLVLLIFETLILCLLCAFLISKTSFGEWTAPRPLPLILTLLGSAALWGADHFARTLSSGQFSKRLWIILISVIAGVIVYGMIALNVTGPAVLAPGEELGRALYLKPGSYTLTLDADSPVADVKIKSQTREEAMMRTGSTLFKGEGKTIDFTVPAESVVTFFTISLPTGGTVRSAACSGDSSSIEIPLQYEILPGFIARRLQGLAANENAIQRLVFFHDGLKIFQKSPIIGNGMGGFEDNVRSVQLFFYESRYVHNHYIQSLVETGVIGLILFLGLLVSSGIAVFRKWKNIRHRTSLVPALGAALLFMAGHAIVEFGFSHYFYLPVAFSVFVLISLLCGEALPCDRSSGLKIRRVIKYIYISIITFFTVFFAVLIGRNLSANELAGGDMIIRPRLDKAVELDAFEWPDYLLKFIRTATRDYVSLTAVAKKAANNCADKLSKLRSLDSIYLAEYYLKAGNWDRALEELAEYLDYVRSDDSAWDEALHLLKEYQQKPDSPYYGNYIKIKDMLLKKLSDWLSVRMGVTLLNPESGEFLNMLLR